MMKFLFLSATLLLSQMSLANSPKTCSLDRLVEAPELSSVYLRDLQHDAKYIKIDNQSGLQCAVILKSVDGGYAISERFDNFGDLLFRFMVNTASASFCVENNSIWEIKESGLSGRDSYLILKRIDKPSEQALKFDTYYESTMAGAKKNGAMSVLKCQE